VDTIIEYCDDKELADSALKPVDSYPLQLHKATCLNRNLGIYEDCTEDDSEHPTQDSIVNSNYGLEESLWTPLLMPHPKSTPTTLILGRDLHAHKGSTP
jgi:hypothetical protein